MNRGCRRLAAVLLIAAALANGLFGPLAHGHALAGTVTAPDVIFDVSAGPAVAHAGCHTEDADDAGAPGHTGKHPGGSGLLCGGSAACCAAVAMIELIVIEHRERVAPKDSPRLVRAGLSPPVGERPPSRA